MSQPASMESTEDQVRVVVKNTFIDFECFADINRGAWPRRKSAPSMLGLSLAMDQSYPATFPEPSPAPTVCPSVVDEDLSDLEDTASGRCSSKDSVRVSPRRAMSKEQHAPTSHEAPQPQGCAVPAEAQSSAHCSHVEDQQPAQNIAPADETTTTLMVRNLPPELTQSGLVQMFVDEGCRGLYDFVYMPMNFRGSGSFGYSFVNFISHAIAEEVMNQMQGREQPGFEGLDIMWSNCQGLSANIERYRNSPLMHNHVPQECKPAVYDSNGSIMPFPKPTKAITKPRVRKPARKAKSGAAGSHDDDGHDSYGC